MSDDVKFVIGVIIVVLLGGCIDSLVDAMFTALGM